MKDLGPEYQRGSVLIDLQSIVGYDPFDCIFGVQLHDDGRIWVCINGVTWLRFKPNGKDILELVEKFMEKTDG